MAEKSHAQRAARAIASQTTGLSYAQILELIRTGGRGAGQPASATQETEPELSSSQKALNQIAFILRDPEWAPGMLEDIADIVNRAGADTSTLYSVARNDEELGQLWLTPKSEGLNWVEGSDDSGMYTEEAIDEMKDLGEIPGDVYLDPVPTWSHH